MKVHIESINYYVEIFVPQMIRLLDLDADAALDFIKILESVGASDINYNGHFGPNVFFTAEEKDLVTIFNKLVELVEAL